MNYVPPWLRVKRALDAHQPLNPELCGCGFPIEKGDSITGHQARQMLVAMERHRVSSDRPHTPGLTQVENHRLRNEQLCSSCQKWLEDWDGR